MSALNVRILGDRGLIITDGAAYSADLAVTHLVNKVTIAPDLNVAVGCSGPIGIADGIINCFRAMDLRTADACFAAFAEVAQRVEAAGNAAIGGPVPQWRAALVGWSESEQRPRGFLLSSRNEPSSATSTRAAFTVAEIAAFESPSAGGLVNEISDDNIEPASVRLVATQRNTRSDHRDAAGRGMFVVGGFVQMTSVTADGIHSKILRRWDDPVGKPIDPNRR